MTILVCAPHPDDEVIGMGGTIAKYAEDGERVVAVVFTLGERSHPWQRQEAIRTRREREALKAGRIVGIDETIFLRLKDLEISTQVVEHDTSKRFAQILADEQPRAIFTTAPDDVHADHRSVARFVLAAAEQASYKEPIWTYTVWNPIHLLNRSQPLLVVDITKTFSKKWEAIQAYESQRVSTYQLIPTVLIRGFLHGLRHGHAMAEVFVKAP